MALARDAAVAEDDDAAAVCSHHPERRASITCPHCGSYACGECTVDTLWGDVMCEDCRNHGRAQYPLPWEQAISPVSFLETAYLLFAETAPCFADLPRGRVLRALGFALTVSLVLTCTTLLSGWLFPKRHWADDVPSALGMWGDALIQHLPSTVLFVIVVSLAFHVSATLLGGKTSFVTSLRAASYLSVIQLLELAVILVNTLLMASTPVTLIIRLVGAFFLVWALMLVAQHRFALSRGRALVAGLAPAAVFALGLVGLLFALARVL